MTGVVRLPSGAVVRGRRLGASAPPVDFGLVLAAFVGRHAPPWPYRFVRWPDLWVPANRDDALDALREALDRAHAGQQVEVSCRGGVGRTGTALAALAVLDGASAAEALDLVRSQYDRRAVETPWQRRFLSRLR